MDTILLLFFGFAGAVTGSFAGVVAERLYTGTSWVTGRSACNSCGRLLNFFDLVPVVSWFFFAGRCRTCRSLVPMTYVVVESVLGILFALSYHTLTLGIPLLLFLTALTLCAIIVLYDLRHTVVPTVLSFPLVLVSFFFALSLFKSMEELGVVLLTAGCIGLGFFLLHVLSRGKAMGLGDTPVALSLALLTGGTAIAGLMFSFWTGAVVGILILVFRRGGPRMGIEVPFVPFLVFGFLLAYFSGWSPFLNILL